MRAGVEQRSIYRFRVCWTAKGWAKSKQAKQKHGEDTYGNRWRVSCRAVATEQTDGSTRLNAPRGMDRRQEEREEPSKEKEEEERRQKRGG